MLPPEFAACRAGARWRWDGVDVHVLDNDGCVLRLAIDGCSLTLIGAQYGRPASQWLQSRGQGAAGVLWPPTATIGPLDAERMAGDAPQVALLSTTTRAARSPRPSAILRAWRVIGARVYVTGADGALELRCAPGGTMSVASWRKP